MKPSLDQIKTAAKNLLAQIDLQTDCMSDEINRETLDQYMDELESALVEGIGKMSFHVQELRPEVLAFALLMEQRLREKDTSKGQSWKLMPKANLNVHAITKMTLVDAAIANGEQDAATRHAIDLANYCMMIGDIPPLSGSARTQQPDELRCM